MRGVEQRGIEYPAIGVSDPIVGSMKKVDLWKRADVDMIRADLLFVVLPESL